MKKTNPLTYAQKFGTQSHGRYKNPEGLQRSFFDKDGYRYRVMHRRMLERWEYLELKQNSWMPNVNHITYIYTLEQAIELEIDFRGNWEEPKPDTEKEYFNNNTYCQKDDWVLTDTVGPLDEYWVIQVLWRNNSGWPHLRTGTGTYVFDSNNNKHKPFDAWDYKNDQKAGTSDTYGNKDMLLNGKQKMMAQLIASNIKEYGYYSMEVVKISYACIYNLQSVRDIRIKEVMRSESIMNAVAKELKDIMKNKGADLGFVVENLMEMGKDDREKIQEIRLEVLKLLGSMNNAPMYQLTGNSGNGAPEKIPVEVEDVRANNDLKNLGIE